MDQIPDRKEVPYKTPHEARLALHPHTKTTVEPVGGLAALYHRGIPTYPDTSEFLFGKEGGPTFDYMNLRLTDFTRFMRAEFKNIKNRFDSIVPGSELSKMDFPSFAKQEINLSYNQQPDDLTQILSPQIKSFSPSVDAHPFSKEGKISDQLYILESNFGHVFRLRTSKVDGKDDWELFHDFQKTVQASSEKPFLLVTVHGAADLRGESPVWIVGEDTTKSHLPIQDLMKYIYDKEGPNHYSAIVLDICNLRRLTVEKYDDTPIYFTMGNATMDPYEDHYAVKI